MYKLGKSFLVFLLVIFLLPILSPGFFPARAETKKLDKCDLQPNEAKVYTNSSFFPFLRNNGGDWPRDPADIDDGIIPPEDYVWNVYIIDDGNNNEDVNVDNLDPIGTIKTHYVNVRDGDDNIRIQFDQDRMILDRNNDGRVLEDNPETEIFEPDLDKLSYSDFAALDGFPDLGPGDDTGDYELYAEGDPDQRIADGAVFWCEHKADDWVIINDEDKNLIPVPEHTQTFDLDSVDTGLGEIPSEPFAFAGYFVRIAIGIAGGVAFLLMLFGAFRLMFAGGNPESIENGRSIITAAVIGLIVVVFSIFLIRLIGVSILGLPI